MIKISQLQDQNPWWQKKITLPEAKMPKRFLHKEISKQINSRFVLGILGLRRVGKSTLLKQIICRLLERKINPIRIFYFSFDQDMVIKTADALESCLTGYFSEILEEKPSLLKKPVYIFIDEIQYIDFWQDVIKRYYDLSPKIKFFITGSQSIILSGKSKESLAGRMYEYYLEPLCFDEFLLIANKKIIRKNYINDVFAAAATFTALAKENYSAGRAIEKNAKEYLLAGQFPEIAKIKNIKDKYYYIKESIIGKILEKDIPQFYEITKVANLKIMAEHLIENSSSLFAVNNIARNVGINRLTAESYFTYLEKGYLINTLYRHTKSKIKQGRLLKKSYAHSINFICALGGWKDDYYNEVPGVFGKVVETYVFNVFKNMAVKHNYDLSFFSQGNKEIDFIIRNRNKICPIEVKFKTNILNSDFKYLVDYCCDKKIKHGIVVTKNLIEKRNIRGVNILFVPFYFF
ncbi:ATP-binding protein [Candidatus Parcubacteria bacterium]|nr:ATP-binding protein [Candidatus Parcubacteria bacterium]